MKLSQLVTCFALAGASVGTFAAPVAAVPGYCNTSGLPTGVTQGTPGAGLVVGNMTLNGGSATNCFGHVDIGNGESPADITNFANAPRPTAGLWGGNWGFIVRDDGSNPSYSGVFSGFSFAFSAAQGSTNGDWTLTVTDLTPGVSPYLPITLDLLVYVKGGNGGDFFFFNDKELMETNPGKYQLSFIQGQGANAGVAGLSGFSLLARDLTGSECPRTNPDCKTPPNEIPEPGSLALVGLALFAAGAARYRRKG